MKYLKYEELELGKWYKEFVNDRYKQLIGYLKKKDDKTSYCVDPDLGTYYVDPFPPPREFVYQELSEIEQLLVIPE